ncbi:PREDICTED: hemK methyltransferase family member 1-like, partial [Wasmannia auropunctata]|uniref:hemK methyltransferase family member 1-like n=1 Tax=Wasmannia auropunctata TaxID=64793 RepID=UPI0005EDC2FD
MGVGSGALALALLYEAPQLRAAGADISAGAVRQAQKNAEAAGVAARFTALKSDWFGAVRGKFDFIISNPPYIPRAEIEKLAAEVRLYDPKRALDGGLDGLDFYRAMVLGAPAHLKRGGKVAVEIGYNQKADV